MYENENELKERVRSLTDDAVLKHIIPVGQRCFLLKPFGSV